MSLRFVVTHALAGLAFVLLACQPAETPAEPPSIESDQDKAFYSLGFRLAEGLAGFGFTPDELELLVLGIRDHVGKKPSRVQDTARFARIAQDIEKERSAVATEREHEKAAAYMHKLTKE